MKNALTFGIIILGCCISVPAQSSGYYQIPSTSTSEYSHNQAQSYQGNSAEQFQSYSAEPAAMAANQSAKQKTTVQGCLAQSHEGIFILSDASGRNYQLNDSMSRLSQFVGKEIRVDGFGLFNGDAAPGAMSLDLSTTQQIEVTRIRKIADKCQTRSGSK